MRLQDPGPAVFHVIASEAKQSLSKKMSYQPPDEDFVDDDEDEEDR